jgi:hypothetical protein
MRTPNDRAAADRPPGKAESATRRPRSGAGPYGGKRPGDWGRVLSRVRAVLPDRGTAAFLAAVSTVASASAPSGSVPC